MMTQSAKQKKMGSVATRFCLPLKRCKFAVSMARSLLQCDASEGTNFFCFKTSYKAAACVGSGDVRMWEICCTQMVGVQ